MVTNLSSVLTAAAFCAVELRVFDTQGRGLASPIEVVDSAGRVVAKTKTDDAGEVGICDFGFGLHEIRVAPNQCNSTVIDGVRLIYGRTQRFSAVLNSCLHYQRSQCLAYFRVREREGNSGLRDVTVRTGRGHTETTDEYGRAGFYFPHGETETFTFMKAGFKGSEVKLHCKDPVGLEREVSLERIDTLP
jgi:hypothetical protein